MANLKILSDTYPTQDELFQFLGTEGHTGTINDRIASYLGNPSINDGVAGGGGGGGGWDALTLDDVVFYHDMEDLISGGTSDARKGGTGTTVNVSNSATAKFGSNSFYVGPNSDTIVWPASSDVNLVATDFTISLWYNWTVSKTLSLEPYIIGNYINGNNTGAWGVTMSGTFGTADIRFRANRGATLAGDYGWTVPGDTHLDEGVWKHLYIERDGLSIECWLDGVSLGSFATSDGDMADASGSVSGLALGRNNSNLHTDMLMDDVILATSALGLGGTVPTSQFIA